MKLYQSALALLLAINAVNAVGSTVVTIEREGTVDKNKNNNKKVQNGRKLGWSLPGRSGPTGGGGGNNDEGSTTAGTASETQSQGQGKQEFFSGGHPPGMPPELEAKTDEAVNTPKDQVDPQTGSLTIDVSDDSSDGSSGGEEENTNNNDGGFGGLSALFGGKGGGGGVGGMSIASNGDTEPVTEEQLGINATHDTTMEAGGGIRIESDTSGEDRYGGDDSDGGYEGESYDNNSTGIPEEMLVDGISESELFPGSGVSEEDTKLQGMIDEGIVDPESGLVIPDKVDPDDLIVEESEIAALNTSDANEQEPIGDNALLHHELEVGATELPERVRRLRELKEKAKATAPKIKIPSRRHIINKNKERNTAPLSRRIQDDDGEEVDDTDSSQGEGHRKLQYHGPYPDIDTFPIGLFHPLERNVAVGLDTLPCNNTFSSLMSGNAAVTVPVGQCFTLDVTGDIKIDGLDIHGKLYIPTNHKATIITTHVFVQGILEMSDDQPKISKDNVSMKIMLVGEADQTFTPADSNAGVAGGIFNAGRKAFIVAGGQLKIKGWDGSIDEHGIIDSWTTMLETAMADPPNPPLSNVTGTTRKSTTWAGDETAPINPPPGCPRQVVNHDFNEDPHLDLWTAGDGQIIHMQNSSLVIHDHVNVEWQGYKLDFTEIAQNCPLIPNATYLVTIRLMMEPEDPALIGTPTPCESMCTANYCPVSYITDESGHHAHCPRIIRKVMHSNPERDSYAEYWMRPGSIGKFGEWFSWSTVWTFSDNDISDTVIGNTFHLERFPQNTKLHMDDFLFELPSEKSFANPNDVCREIVVNGDAEDMDGNGYAFFPFYSSDYGRFNPDVREEIDENGVTNKYFEHKKRVYGYHSTRVYINSDCFVQGYVYTASVSVRAIGGNIDPFQFYVQMCGNRAADNRWHCEHIIGTYHNPQLLTKSDGWVTFEQDLLVTELVAGLTNLRWEFIGDPTGHNIRRDGRPELHLDNISIEYKSGPAIGIKVDGSVTDRWDVGSDVHITSSTVHWMDSQDAVVSDITMQSDGNSAISLEGTGITAVLSEEDTPGMGVEVALLSRNLQIEGYSNPEDCGYEYKKMGDYRGSHSTTKGGYTCQNWIDQTVHTHDRTIEKYPNAGLGDHNYCRNPDSHDGSYFGQTWCYTDNPAKRWDWCEVPKCVGGYLQVFHTPNVPQVIEGVEFKHMGQPRGKNRFPLQFLYTRDVNGTSISRNSIRNSLHRCISMDGVSNATIAANVAADTAGHCYYIGFEADDNKILHNLGSRTNNRFSWRDPKPSGYGDHDRATFHFSNPNNDWIGNVAAGSAGRGWEAAMDWRNRGEDNKDRGNLISPNTSRRRLPLGTFKNNKAHSNYWQGFRFHHFEQFFQYRNDVNVPKFENMMAYRNREHGIYAYNVIAAEYNSGKFYDNQYGMVLRVGDRTTIRDVDIKGSSEEYKDHTIARSTDRQLCRYTNWDHFGLMIGSRVWRTGHTDPGLGMRLKNVTISGLDKEKSWYPNCQSTYPMVINPWDVLEKHFDYITSVEDTKIVDSRGAVIDACKAETQIGVKDIVITDVDGSLDPTGQASFGSLVQDQPFVHGIFGDGACSSTGNCMAYCPELCLRTFTYKVEQFRTHSWVLRITNTDTNHTMDVPGTIRTINDEYFSDAYAGRHFSASLPEGKYTTEFIDEDGNQAWPVYLEEYWSKEPDCSGYATGGRRLLASRGVKIQDVTTLKPEITEEHCIELFRNAPQDSPMNKTEPWIHTLNLWGRDLAVENGLGDNSTDALATTQRHYHWTGIAQNIDSRCLELMEGQYYEFKVKLKITPKGDPTTTIQDMDLDKCWWENKAPILTFNGRQYRDEITKEHQYTWETRDQAHMTRPYNNDDWNQVHGIVRIPKTHRLFTEIERHPNAQEQVIDSASFKKMECDPDRLLLNGDMEGAEGTTKYWDTWGERTRISPVSPGIGGTGYALKSHSRTHYSHAQAQIINPDCTPYEDLDRYAFMADIKFESNGVTVPCNVETWSGDRCADFRMYTNKGGKREYHRVAMITSNDGYNKRDGWYRIAGLRSLNANQAGAEYMKIYFENGDQNVDIVTDNVEVKYLPKQCKTLIENSDFSQDIDFWEPTDESKDRVMLNLVEGANGGDDKAVRVHSRDHRWRGLMQRLDSRCFTVGEEITISAKFKLQNSTGHTIGCDTNHQWGSSTNCPNVMIKGRYCDGGDVYWRFWNSLSNWETDQWNAYETMFTVNQQLASCRYVYVYAHEVPQEQDLLVNDLQLSTFQSVEPTVSPTPMPTEEDVETDIPTLSPSSMPTSSDVMSCPNEESNSTEISSGSVMLARSNTLCVLTKATPKADGSLADIVPVALSYEDRPWEKAAGEYAALSLYGQDFGNYAEGSQMNLPALSSGDKYYLTSYSNEISSDDDKVARFLETATFGTTREDIASMGVLSDDSFKQWIENQIAMKPTYHREYLRRRSNFRLTNPIREARNDHPCDSLSRWRKYAISSKEGERGVWTPQIFEARYTNGTDDYVTLMLNGFPRTVVKPERLTFPLNSEWTLEYNREYETCWTPQDYVDGSFYIEVREWISSELPRACERLQNPLVQFLSNTIQPSQVVQLPDIAADDLELIDKERSHGGDYILTNPSGLSDTLCDNLGDVTEEGDPPVFGRLPDGSHLIYDARVRLADNEVEHPISDGGGMTRTITGERTRCANAPRTFLNEENCTLSPASSTCGSAGTPDLLIELNSDNLITFHNITDQYVYAIQGLPLVCGICGISQEPVCEPGLRSRWAIIDDVSQCSETDMDAQTNETLFELLLQRGNNDFNPKIRDLFFPLQGSVCAEADSSLVEVEIIIGGKCFRRVHPEEMSVFDFTYWTEDFTHPGNMIAAMQDPVHSNPIKKWMDIDQSAILTFPYNVAPDAFNNDTLARHGIDRWDAHNSKFVKIGRYLDEIKFVDLPNEVRTTDVAEFFGAETGIVGSAILVCGSPQEVQNDPKLGQVFEVEHERMTHWGNAINREYTWYNIALDAPDQLRQRVAWALAQILVVAIEAVGIQGSLAEAFAHYHDIFVRNAFGNYHDALKEISYSPIMAENLSFLQSKSAAYMWEILNKKSFADENFAREIMQLFSTGITKLNLDGTPVRDENGKPEYAYDNEQIMSLARVWTGFDYQPGRGNVEDTSRGNSNHFDPMKIQSQWRDKFPKSDMTDGYIGDGYPLCVDLPDKMFLRKNAAYRLLGQSHMPELMEDESRFKNDPNLRKLVLDSNSPLAEALCGTVPSMDFSNCNWENTVTLDENLLCDGENYCIADTVRVVQLGFIHYEYVRPPCVEQAFFANPKKVLFRERWSDASCANPLLPYASEACCDGTHDLRAERFTSYLYDQERVTAATADARCQAMGKFSCDFNDIELIDWYRKGYHWTNDDCAIQAKVDATGQVAIVYEPDNYAYLHRHVRDDNRNFFKVYWDSDDYPKNDDDFVESGNGNSCGNSGNYTSSCRGLPIGGCLCDTSITESRVFRTMPTSIVEVLSTLTVGAFDPESYDQGTYEKHGPVNGVTVYLVTGKGYDTDTVIEVTDSYNRLHRFKNTREVVYLAGTHYSFRNTPSFMSVLNTEADARDAHYETQAALNHYFYHDNTAPFISHRLIQRLTNSNPSPKYVEAVATAFRTGTHEGIGSGKYGDLSATVSAIMLEPEARSIHLDKYPFKGLIKEPLHRVMSTLRGMEVQKADGQPLIKLVNLKNKIGMAPHRQPSVFNFYLAEFQPGGRPGKALMQSPEAMITDMPMNTNMYNALYSFIDFGVNRCSGGLGSDNTPCRKGDFSRSPAWLSFQPSGNSTDADSVIRELNTILASGRLDDDAMGYIKEAFLAKLDEPDLPNPEGEALRLAQKMIMSAPEFHTTNLVQKTGEPRPPLEPQVPSGAHYKAIVYVMFGGGCDSFNMLVPHTCTVEDPLTNMTLRDEYDAIRAQVQLSPIELNELNSVTNQGCEKFGTHPNLVELARLFNDGDLLFFTNTGVLTKPTNKENYYRDTETQLFAHNHMQQAAQRVDPMKMQDGTGILGRIRDSLQKKKGLSVGAFSLNTNAIVNVGKQGTTESPMIISGSGVTQFDPSVTDQEERANMKEVIGKLNGQTTQHSGVLGDWYGENLMEGLARSEALHETLDGIETSIEFPNSGLCSQFEMVAKMIDSRNERGSDMDFFFTSRGGWDTHTRVLPSQINLFSDVDACFSALAEELKAKNVWESVTVVQVSDFGRTLNPNGNDGTDHAWGGNYIMMGGAVKGGQIPGTYPHVRERAPLNVGRGRMIPTLPWESVFKLVGDWVGVDEEDYYCVEDDPAFDSRTDYNPDYDCILPNLKNFDESHIFQVSDFFEPDPTFSPSKSPVTDSPTGSPSKSPVTDSPSKSPVTNAPTDSPSQSPVTDAPTDSPSKSPVTDAPTSAPSKNPVTAAPSENPVTPAPSKNPTTSPETPAPTPAGTDSLATSGPTPSETIDRLRV